MKALELFAGIGGIALAAEWAGIETVAFCERDPFCQKILNKHWLDVPVFDDIKTLNTQVLEERGVDVGAIELISGGFPCQPYSVAGKRKGTDDDRDLWPEMFRIIEEIRPTWVVGENVANFANMELDRTLSDLESIGYKGKSFIIPACAVDAKHRRDRIFIVAYSDSVGCDDGKHNRKERQFQNKFDRNNAESKQKWDGRFDRLGEICSVFSDTYSNRCGQMEQHDCGRKKSERSVCETRECSFQFGGRESRWQPEPGVGRVAHGIPNRVDRIRGLGNAVVPQQIYPIFKYIKMIHEQLAKEVRL